MRFAKLETVLRRAPLGMRFLDLVRGVTVTDGLAVNVWHIGTLGPKQRASVSPLSGVYGFRMLPGLRRFEVGERPATDWCASPPDLGEPTADELTSLGTLQGFFQAEDSPPAGANFIVSLEDLLGRFLPQMLLMCLPKEHLLEVPLFSAPNRLAPAGLAVVRGQLALAHTTPPQPASWAMVTASLDGHSYVGIADARGMFVLFIPYASALPPLTGSPPHGSGNIDQLTWSLTLAVFYQPTRQRFVPQLALPDTLSLLEQGQAQVYDQLEAASSSLVRFLHFGGDLVITTVGQSQLLLDPAP